MSVLADAAQDLRHGLRALRRTPAFTIGAVVTLALAIGANSAIFSVVRGVLLRQLPFAEPERVFWIWSDQPGRERSPFNVPDFGDYRDRNRSLEGFAGFFGASVNLSEDDATERLQGIRATGNVFEVLGVAPEVGRLLSTEDERPGQEHVVVLGHSFWRRRFGADAGVVGRSVRLNGESHTVVGVLPAGFATPIRDLDFAVPFVVEADPRRQARNSVSFIVAAGRLKTGVSRAQAQADLTSIARRLQERYPVENARKRGVRLVPAVDGVVGAFRTTLLALFGAVVAVLLLACANLANLTLSRAASRRKEVAVRLALGSPRSRLVRLALTETLLLGAAGGVMGLLLARWGLSFLLCLAPTDLPRLDGIRVDAVVALYSLGVALLTGVAFGLLPALGAATLDARDALRASNRGSSDRGGAIRNALVACEVAVAFVLLTVVGLFGRSFARLQAVPPGFVAEGTLSARLALPPGRYADPATIARFREKLEQGVSALPGVRHVGSVSLLPLSGLSARVPFTVEGQPIDRQHVPYAHFRIASPGYFEAMGIPLLRGRRFTDHDGERAAPVALVSASLAAQWLAAREDPIGARLLVDDNDGQPRPIEVIGVVGGVRQMTLDGDPGLDLYLPYPQIHPDTVGLASGNLYLVVRTAGDPMALAPSVAEAVRHVDPDVAASNLRSLESYLAGSLAPRRFSLVLVSVFSLASLLLAVAGVYAVISYGVGQRSREIAIRMALGARSTDVLLLVVGQGMRSATLGVLVAIPGALAVTRGLESLLFGVAPTDPSAFAAAAIVLLATTLAACALPAMRATRVRASSLGAE